MNALLGAHVTAAVLNWSEVGEQVIAGKVRALATMAAQRIEPLPDLPTVSESGYKDFETDVWFGLVAPAKTPKETVAQLIDWFRTRAACAGGQGEAHRPGALSQSQMRRRFRRPPAASVRALHAADPRAEHQDGIARVITRA